MEQKNTGPRAESHQRGGFTDNLCLAASGQACWLMPSPFPYGPMHSLKVGVATNRLHLLTANFADIRTWLVFTAHVVFVIGHMTKHMKSVVLCDSETYINHSGKMSIIGYASLQ